MRYAYQVAAVRTAERALMDLVPEGALMQRAAAGLASACASLLARQPGHVYGARVVVLAGSGDNGGDALYAGALLARRGAAVTAIAPGPKAHDGGLTELRAAGGRVTDGGAGAADLIARADLIMDGLLGIGGHGGLREPFAGLARLTEQARQGGPGHEAGATVVAVDLPSGIDADTGAVEGPAVRADVTVAFGTIKPGLLIDPGAWHAGAVELVDIGLGPYLEGEPAALAPQRDDISERLPRPGPESDKYRRGVVGLLAGSDRFAGAAVLATGGAVRGGAGMVRVATADVPAAVVRQTWPEAVLTVHPDEGDWDLGAVGRVQAWVAGPGMGTGRDAAARLAAVLATGLPALVDADGLTIVSQTVGLLPRAKGEAPTLITPHAGELARLLGTEAADVEARRLEHARRAADEFGVTVLLKGSTTVIARPGHPTVLVNPTGTPWLATAGTGDVLSGLAGSLLAQGLEPAWAAAAAAYLHGLAARLAAAQAGHPGEPLPAGVPVPEAPIGASDVVRSLPDAFRALAAP
jgi:ADP-dependent NAD(P)H-hydrate dehydratase / NAD(P)H-hydrate epimerase